MSILNKFNKGKLFEYDKDEKRIFINFKELKAQYPKEVYPIRALFINKESKFGDAPVIVIDGLMVNAPSHLTPTVKEMIQDNDLVDLVNQGKVGFSLYEYDNEYGKALSCNWVELKD